MEQLTESQRSGLNRRPLSDYKAQSGGISRSLPSVTSEKRDGNDPAPTQNRVPNLSPSCPPLGELRGVRFKLTDAGREAGLSSEFPIGKTIGDVLNWIRARYPNHAAPGCFGCGFWF